MKHNCPWKGVSNDRSDGQCFYFSDGRYKMEAATNPSYLPSLRISDCVVNTDDLSLIVTPFTENKY